MWELQSVDGQQGRHLLDCSAHAQYGSSVVKAEVGVSMSHSPAFTELYKHRKAGGTDPSTTVN